MSYPKKPQNLKNAKAGKEPSTRKDDSVKREQLKTLLVNKFKSKYSAELRFVDGESLISAEVSKFVAHSALNEAELHKLDTAIGDALRTKLKASKKQKEPKEKTGERGGHEKDQDSPQSESPQKTDTFDNEKALEDVWACIVEYNTMQHEEEMQALASKHKEMQSKMKQELDRQIEEKKKIRENRLVREHELEDKQVKLETAEEKKEKMKEVKHKETTLQEKMVSQKIFESTQNLLITPIDTKAKRSEEQDKEKAADKEMVRRVQAEIEQEFIVTGKKKFASKEQEREMLRALADTKKRQENEKKRETLDEEKMVREQSELLRREQKHKEEMLKKKQEKMMVLEHAANKTAQILSGPNNKDKLIAQEDVTSLALEDNHEQLVAKLKSETVSTLKKQIEEKKLKGEEKKKLNNEVLEQWKVDSVKYDEKEREKADQAKRKLYENKEKLVSQMEEKKLRAKVQMGKEEFLVNKQLIEKAVGAVKNSPRTTKFK